MVLYLATVPWTDDFRAFLLGHTALLRMASSWTLRIVFPQPLRRLMDAYRAVVHEELESPLQIPEALRAFLNRCAQVFGGPRFTHLYKRWLPEDEAALVPVSPAIPEALASGRAKIECLVLPHTYDHLSPLVSRRRTRRRGRRTGEQRGDAAPHSINPFLNPAP